MKRILSIEHTTGKVLSLHHPAPPSPAALLEQCQEVLADLLALQRLMGWQSMAWRRAERLHHTLALMNQDRAQGQDHERRDTR